MPFSAKNPHKLRDLDTNKTKLATKQLIILGQLLALAIILRFAEDFLIPPFPGGIKIGIANTITIVVLYLFGTKKSIVFLCARIILSGLLSANFLSSGFLIGTGGAFLSFFFMSQAVEKNWFSPIGVGLLGAATHNIGQIFVVLYLIQSPAIVNILPFLMLISIPTGMFTGAIAKFILPIINKNSHL